MNKLVKAFMCSILSLALVACSTKTPPEVDNSNSITFDEGIVYDDPKTYDEGTITADGAVIENAKFDGNLTIDKAVLDGDVTLRNVTVKGDLIVKGGGQNSIHIESSQIGNIVSNKEGSPVRIKADEFSSVKNITMENPTVLEISGKVDTLTVNAKAVGSDVKFDAKSTIKDITINGNIEFSSETPINDLVINAPSNLTLNSTVASLQLKEEASDTKVTLGENSVVTNVVTTVAVEISGTGKVENVVTDKEENMTGEVKGENVEVKENPFNEVKPSVEPTTTPEPTVRPTVKPTATPKPTDKPVVVVPTTAPTAVPTPTPTPTTVPIPTPKVTVTFELDGYTVAPQTIDKGAKATKPEVTLSEEEYAGSSVVWFDVADKEFDFSSTVSTATTLKGKVVSGVKNEDTLIAAISSDKVKNIYFEEDIIAGTMPIIINRNLNVLGNNKTITSNATNVFEIEGSITTTFENLKIIGNGEGSIGIMSTTKEASPEITVRDSMIKTKGSGIRYNSSSKRRYLKLDVINSKIHYNADENYDEWAHNIGATGSRGISLYDCYGDVSVINSEIHGYTYSINLSGTATDPSKELKINVDNSTLKGRAGVNVWSQNNTVTIKESTLKGINIEEDEEFGTIVLDKDSVDNAKNNTFIFENSTITNYLTGKGSIKYLINLRASNAKFIFKGVINLIDTTNSLESAILLTPDNAGEMLSNGIITDGATIISKRSDGTDLPIALDSIPEINNAIIEYNEASENIIIKFDIDKGYTLTSPDEDIKDLEALTAVYTELLTGNTEQIRLDAAKRLGNDLILNYYYKDGDVDKSLLTESD